MSGPCLSSSVAVHPLRPATRLSLGRPLPHQLADAPQAHPQARASMDRPALTFRCHAVLAPLSGCYPPLEGRSPTCYSPVRHSVTPCGATAFDLHVLGTPPALILSQDQTLMLNSSAALASDATQLTRGRFGSALFNPFVYVVVAADRLRTD